MKNWEGDLELSIILASASPRRNQLLRQLGLDFTVIPADVDEKSVQAASFQELAGKLAHQKAELVASLNPQAVVIAADTIVVIDGRVLGKPEDLAAARTMLGQLSGRAHQVITGLSVHCQAQGYKKTVTEITRVEFRSLNEDEIEAYIESGEPFDKAGGYGIQGLGALLVEKIDGCYFNVVGLPLNRLGLVLREVGVNILGR